MRPAKKQIHFISLTVLCDLLAVVASVFSAYFFRFFSGIVPLRWEHPGLAAYARALVVVLPVYLGFFRAYGLYTTGRHIRRIEEIFLVVKAVSFSIVILMAITFFYRGFSYSRIYLIILWIFSILFVSLARYYLIQWEYRRKVHKKEMAKVLVVGGHRNARGIIQWAKNNPHYGKEVVGILARDASLVGKHLEGVPILGVVDQCESFMDHLRPDEVILLDSHFPRERITDLVATCEDQMMEFKMGADLYGLMTRNVDVEYISSVPLLGFRSLPLDDLWNRFAKRIFDIVVSLFLLMVTWPLWLLTAMAIQWHDRGPIFFKQQRMGRDQKIFDLLKFRTMRVDAERQTGPVWAKPQDSRRTSIGNFLRRWNLDELPQLLNVLKGDMSLVGPRPERPHFVHQFRHEIPRYMARHKIKSGLTGWAQVNGFRGNTSLQERIKYDLYYMENWSLLFDVEILIMTAFAFKNAY
jgi:exopolysaccharide biosynthesis polyprenyl glycosylphosphotransferase